MQPYQKSLDFRFPLILVEKMGHQIYVFSKLNISKNIFGLNRFSLENLRDFLRNAPNLLIFEIATSHIFQSDIK